MQIMYILCYMPQYMSESATLFKKEDGIDMYDKLDAYALSAQLSWFYELCDTFYATEIRSKVGRNNKMLEFVKDNNTGIMALNYPNIFPQSTTRSRRAGCLFNDFIKDENVARKNLLMMDHGIPCASGVGGTMSKNASFF